MMMLLLLFCNTLYVPAIAIYKIKSDEFPHFCLIRSSIHGQASCELHEEAGTGIHRDDLAHPLQFLFAHAGPGFEAYQLNKVAPLGKDPDVGRLGGLLGLSVGLSVFDIARSPCVPACSRGGAAFVANPSHGWTGADCRCASMVPPTAQAHAQKCVAPTAARAPILRCPPRFSRPGAS